VVRLLKNPLLNLVRKMMSQSQSNKDHVLQHRFDFVSTIV
jgi:hypothetical protein